MGTGRRARRSRKDHPASIQTSRWALELRENEEKNEGYWESESEGTEFLVHCLRTERGRGLGIAKFFIWEDREG